MEKSTIKTTPNHDHNKTSNHHNYHHRQHSKDSKKALHKPQHDSVKSLSIKDTSLFTKRKPKTVFDNKAGSGQSFINLALFVCCFVLTLLVPFVLLRYVLSLELICFNGDLEDPQRECDDSLKAGGFVFSFVSAVSVTWVYLLFARIAAPADGRSDKVIKVVLTAMLILATVVILVKSVLLGEFVVIFSALFSLLYGPLFHRRAYNRGGFRIGLVILLQDNLIFYIVFLFGGFLSTEIVAGITWAILVPPFIQLNQGMLLFVSERTRSICQVTTFNRDAYIFLVKFQMLVISGFKMVVVMAVLSQENPWPTVVLSIITDALGRVQFWRYSYRKLRSSIRKKALSKTLAPLTEVILCSELDMDYIPWIGLVLVNGLNSPLNNGPVGVQYVSDSYLTLRSDSIFSRSWSDLFMILGVLICGDLMTALFYKLMPFCRMYQIRHIFGVSLKQCCLWGIVFAPFLISMMLNFGTVFQ